MKKSICLLMTIVMLLGLSTFGSGIALAADADPAAEAETGTQETLTEKSPAKVLTEDEKKQMVEELSGRWIGINDEWIGMTDYLTQDYTSNDFTLNADGTMSEWAWVEEYSPDSPTEDKVAIPVLWSIKDEKTISMYNDPDFLLPDYQKPSLGVSMFASWSDIHIADQWYDDYSFSLDLNLTEYEGAPAIEIGGHIFVREEDRELLLKNLSIIEANVTEENFHEYIGMLKGLGIVENDYGIFVGYHFLSTARDKGLVYLGSTGLEELLYYELEDFFYDLTGEYDTGILGSEDGGPYGIILSEYDLGEITVAIAPGLSGTIYYIDENLVADVSFETNDYSITRVVTLKNGLVFKENLIDRETADLLEPELNLESFQY